MSPLQYSSGPFRKKYLLIIFMDYTKILFLCGDTREPRVQSTKKTEVRKIEVQSTNMANNCFYLEQCFLTLTNPGDAKFDIQKLRVVCAIKLCMVKGCELGVWKF